MKKEKKGNSIIRGVCPKCQGSKVFVEPNPFKMSKALKLNESCTSCGFSFTPEPSFYTGAMYVSYAFSVAIVVGVFIGSNVLSSDPSVSSMIFWGITIAVVFAPINLRLSRLIWLNVFYRFDPEAQSKFEQEQKKENSSVKEVTSP